MLPDVDNVTHLGADPRTGAPVGKAAVKPSCPYPDCSCWRYANASSVPLRSSDKPLLPSAVFNSPTSIGSCSDVEIDASASTGGGGRNFAAVRWRVNSTTLPPANLTAVQVFAAAEGSVALSIVSADGLLVPGHSCVLLPLHQLLLHA